LLEFNANPHEASGAGGATTVSADPEHAHMPGSISGRVIVTPEIIIAPSSYFR